MLIPERTPIRLLCSYWFFRNVDLDVWIESRLGDWPVDIFADSGGYSAWSSGAEITVEEYATWVKRWRHHLDVIATLDVIGDAAATAVNTARLRDALDTEVIPAFHVNEPWAALEAMLEAGEPYIALGGMVGKAPRPLIAWAAHAHRLAAGTAVFHGFGLTSTEALRALPWYSVDSSTWSLPCRIGAVRLVDPQTWRSRDVPCVIGGPERRKPADEAAARRIRAAWAAVHDPTVLTLLRAWRYDPTALLDANHFARDYSPALSLALHNAQIIEAAIRVQRGAVKPPKLGMPEGVRYFNATTPSFAKQRPWSAAFLDHPDYPGPAELSRYDSLTAQ